MRPNPVATLTPTRADGQASELSPNDVLKPLPIQRQDRDDRRPKASRFANALAAAVLFGI
ncbi:MAG: hypothetical protein AAGF78_12605 [Pseudomonadota bacterium]